MYFISYYDRLIIKFFAVTVMWHNDLQSCILSMHAVVKGMKEEEQKMVASCTPASVILFWSQRKLNCTCDEINATRWAKVNTYCLTWTQWTYQAKVSGTYAACAHPRSVQHIIGLSKERPILDHHAKAHIPWNPADFTREIRMKSGVFHPWNPYEIHWISPEIRRMSWNLYEIRRISKDNCQEW